jgi:hypothetical protein
VHTAPQHLSSVLGKVPRHASTACIHICRSFYRAPAPWFPFLALEIEEASPQPPCLSCLIGGESCRASVYDQLCTIMCSPNVGRWRSEHLYTDVTREMAWSSVVFSGTSYLGRKTAIVRPVHASVPLAPMRLPMLDSLNGTGWLSE